MTATQKKTVGQAVAEILKKPQDNQPIVDTQREMQKGYFNELIKAAKSGEDKYGKVKPFYICVQTRRERLLQYVIRNQFYTRQTRPSPQYDLALFHYDPQSEKLSFVWCIPDKETVDYLIENETELPKEEIQLLSFCKGFKDGTLI